MYSVLLIALGVPVVVLSAGFACRRGPARLAADVRGIALQTVIIIVVMLLIAGGVSAVLVGRSSDVIGELEAASIGTITVENCDSTRVAGVYGALKGTTACEWDATAGKSITRSQCSSAGGKTSTATATSEPAMHAAGDGARYCIADI